MSDVPAAAWWTAALALAVGPRRLSPAWSGLAAGAALATRPNLLPLLVVPASITFFTAHDRLAALKRTGVFVLGALPALAGVAMLNDYWYGSPFRSGYGDLGVLYAFGNAWPNLARYPVWLVQSQTPLVALALAGMAGTGTRAAGPASQIDPRVLGRGVLAFSLLTLGCYVFYVVYDAWWFLRFILPALPALLVLAVGATWRAVTTWLPRHAALAFALLLAVVGAQTLAFARSHGAFDARGRSEPYQELASVLVAKFPANAVFVARQYSGSIRYYTGRSIVRFDYLSPEELRGALAELKTLGYAPYVVLHDSEEAAFRERFRPGAPDAALRLEPMLSLGCCTTVYKPH